ncbi:hypothetical protein GJ633_11125 [Halorubrum sp. CBA1125]|uniref:DUF5791 family protein n=1 Tax=Halorubrum sp. CBA1125 TaxID=2668072 RepID=UPI0012E784E3|nr:DUF5791 family protein [Halorubrum sp. CBA1125]MUW15141.1 hypothetical protein [Halorubrum sp. CBA1125]
MFHEVVDEQATAAKSADAESADAEATDVTAATLRAAFEETVREAAAETGRETIREETDLNASSVDAAFDGDADGLTVADGAAVLALRDDRDADAIVAELRDHLLIGMTTAVLDVDSIASAIEADLTGQEVQQALEGRAAMTLAELAEIAAVIERRKR